MRLLRVLLLLSWLPVTPARAAETFQTPPRPPGVRLRCPLLLSQFRTAASAWRNPTNQGLLRQIAADPTNSFFRQALGERLETDFADDLSGKDEERTRIRGRFLSKSVALERLLERYEVDNIAQLPAHVQQEAITLRKELEELFDKHGARWTPRAHPAKSFQFKNGVVAGVTVDLNDIFTRTDGLTAAQALDAFARKLPVTIHSWEIVGGTPAQLTEFLRWNAAGRFHTLTLGGALGPIEPVVAALVLHAGKLRSIRFEGYSFDPAQLNLLADLGDAVAIDGVPIVGNANAWAVEDALHAGTLVSPRLRQIAWRRLMRNYDAPFDPKEWLTAPTPQMVQDMAFLNHEPEFWKALEQVRPDDLLPLYEALPTKPAERRATFLRKMLLHLPTDSLATFVHETVSTESKSRRMVSPAGSMTNDIFASEGLKDPRFGALRALRAMHEQQRDKELFSVTRLRWLYDEKADVADKAAYVAQEMGDRAVRTIVEGAPRSDHWKQVRAEAERSTMLFAWKAVRDDTDYNSGNPLIRDALEGDKRRWTFSPAGDGTEECHGTFRYTLFTTLDLPGRLNAWAEKSGHPYRYEMSPNSSPMSLNAHLRRRLVAP